MSHGRGYTVPDMLQVRSFGTASGNPVVFALRDRTSLAVGALAAAGRVITVMRPAAMRPSGARNSRRRASSHSKQLAC